MQSIGIIGGTGDLGNALSVHLASSYSAIRIGSRSKEKSDSAVKRILEEKKSSSRLSVIREKLMSATNEEAVQKSDIVIATVPYETIVESIKTLKEYFKDGQLLISTAAPVTKRGNQFYATKATTTSGESESATVKIRRLLPDNVLFASGFQTVPANILYREKEIRSDVPVCCDSENTFDKVSELVSKIQGLRALWVGGLDLSGEIERLTALLLNLGLRNHLKSPTIQITSF